MGNITCRSLRQPSVPDFSTNLMLAIPGHRILSPPRLFIGGSIRARLRTCSFSKCQRWTRERRVPPRCQGFATAPGPMEQLRHDDGRLTSPLPRLPSIPRALRGHGPHVRRFLASYVLLHHLETGLPDYLRSALIDATHGDPARGCVIQYRDCLLRPRRPSRLSSLDQPAAPSPSP